MEDAVRLAILDDYQGVAFELADWSQVAADVSVFSDHIDGDAALAERLAPFAILCLMRERTPISRTLIEQLPNLKLIITPGMGNASIDVTAAADHGVVVCGTDAPPVQGTAELTLAMILALARGLIGETRSVRNGGWQAGLGRNVHGATLGLVGLGRLGGEIARLARAFGMNVIAWSENLSDDRAAEIGVTRVDKTALFEQSDFVSIHLRLAERTRGLVGADEIGRMKSDAYLINTSRSPIVDTDALTHALRNNSIAGAALDVFEREPLPADDPVRSMTNLLATPHIGFVTRETYAFWYPQMAEAAQAFIDGDPIRVIGP